MYNLNCFQNEKNENERKKIAKCEITTETEHYHINILCISTCQFALQCDTKWNEGKVFMRFFVFFFFVLPLIRNLPKGRKKVQSQTQRRAEDIRWKFFHIVFFSVPLFLFLALALSKTQ